MATPAGEGGIAIIRISGDRALDIGNELFVTPKKKKIKNIKKRYMNFGYILDNTKNIVDEVYMVYMKAPKTYTREDIVEIHCHGGMMPVRKILELIMQKGARLAERGEFTKRAFLNGRVDLAQAEAVMDLISSKSQDSAKASISQMEGNLSKKIADMREVILDLLAHIEVTIDYPEEDIDNIFVNQAKDVLQGVLSSCNELLESANQGKLIREGVKTVIIGKPNVGKSSLLNALVKEDRAIVTDIPGTTRDVIEEYITIKGVLVRILDTAGIRETVDLVESIGVERSRIMINGADLILLIFDASLPLGDEDKKILEWIGEKKTLIVLNKIDKLEIIDEADIRELTDKPIIKTSITENIGVDKVEDFIYHLVYSGDLTIKNDLLITNNRHKEVIIRAKEHLSEALDAIDEGMPLDIVTIDIKSAWNALGEIIGETVTENLIDRIFSEFCLGK